MSEEEFIIKFYSCDNEEQFLKDLYHDLNYLQQKNEQLKMQIYAREEEYRKLDETNKVLSQELTKGNICKQNHLHTICGIPIGYMPKFIDKYNKLEDNWNKLKDFLENNWKQSQDIWFVKIINKMKEIEGKSELDERKRFKIKF